MKKIICFFLLSLCLCMLCSCGRKYSMKDWPTIDLQLNIEDYDEVSLEYNLMPNKNNEQGIHFCGVSSDRDVISDIYSSINNSKYSKEIVKRINTEKFRNNVIIKFTKEDETYVFQYYSYGIYDGYFIFNNGEIHKYHGAFATIYDRFKDKFNQEVT